jgi:hypothetical protein
MTDAVVGKRLAIPFQVRTADKILQITKNKSQQRLTVRDFLGMKNTSSRKIPITATATPENAPRNK